MRIILSRIVFVFFFAYVIIRLPPEYLSKFLLDVLELIGLAFLIIASFGRVWCLTYSGGKKNKQLVVQGPYSMMRNPLYVFSFIGVIGLGLAVRNPLLAAMLGVIFVIYYSFVVRKEERKLISIFGDDYKKYMERVPRWFPNFRLFIEPDNLTLNPKHVRIGILDAMWFLWFFFLWELIEIIRFHFIR